MSDETKTPAPEAGAQTPAAAPTLAEIPRSMEAISKEYNEVARALGHLVWQMEISENQKRSLFARLNALGEEASKLPPEAPKKPAPPKLVAAPKAGADGT